MLVAVALSASHCIVVETFLLQILIFSAGYYRFVDFGFAAGGLSVANSKEFRRFDFPDTELSTGSTIPALYDGEIVSLSVGGKIFTAVAYKDEIVIYDNIVEGRVVTSIHSRKPKSLLWFDFGNGKEIFLIFQSRGRILEVFEYKGEVI